MVKLPFFSAKEKILVIEIAPGITSGFLFSLTGDKTLTLERSIAPFAWGKSLPMFHIVRRVPHIIIALRPEFTFTVLKNATLVRAKPRTPIEALEIENFLGQTIARLFVECRPQASAALGVEELHTILMESRATGFAVDGHHVLNPVGVEGRRVTVSLECALTTREVFEMVNTLFSAGKDFFFSDTARAVLLMMEREYGLPVSFVDVDENRSWFFELCRMGKDERRLRRGAFPWTTRAPFTALMEGWGVSQNVARRVEREYLSESFSLNVRRNITKLFDVGAKTLLRAIRSEHLAGKTAVISDRQLPFVLPKHAGRLEFTGITSEDALARAGFTLRAKSYGLPAVSRNYVLASFLEFYYDSSDAIVNRWLKRRLHWIAR